MPNYKDMYYKMFNAMTDAIEILKKAQLEAEEEYINSSEREDKKILELKIHQKKAVKK